MWFPIAVRLLLLTSILVITFKYSLPLHTLFIIASHYESLRLVVTIIIIVLRNSHHHCC